MYGMTRCAGGLLFLAGSLVMLSGATCLDLGVIAGPGQGGNDTDTTPQDPGGDGDTSYGYLSAFVAAGQGSVLQDIPSDQGKLPAGTQVTLTAVPQENWRFSHWEGDLDGSANPITVQVNAGRSLVIHAVFELWRAGTPSMVDTIFSESASCCLSTEPGVKIYYTLDGSTPTSSHGQLYSSWFSVTQTTTIKAIAYKDGLDPSEVATAVYTKQSTLPESPHPYSAGRTLRWMYSHTGGPMVIQFDPRCSLAAGTTCTIYVGAGLLEAQDGYTITCTARDLAGKTLHTLGICGSINITLESSGTAADWGFKIASIERTVRCPAFIPGDTITFNDPIQVGIRAPDFTGAETTMVYTTDGSAPGATGSTTYTQPLTVSDTCVLKAVARQAGVPDSPVVVADLLRRSGYPESSHPIKGSLKPNPTGFAWGTETWVYRAAGHPASISVTFDSRTSLPGYQTDRGFQESISILYPAGTGGEILNLSHITGSPYYGSFLAGKTVVVPGDTVVISMFRSTDTDSWGFRVTNIQPGGTVDPAGNSSLAGQVIERVNNTRASNGLHPLRKNSLLAQAAQGHATRMAELNFFSHTDPYTGSQPWDRVMQAGYDYSAMAENIAQGQPTAEDVMNAWMNSPGHRANILDWYPSEIGMGIYQGGTHGTYWVQLFGNRW